MRCGRAELQLVRRVKVFSSGGDRLAWLVWFWPVAGGYRLPCFEVGSRPLVEVPEDVATGRDGTRRTGKAEG
jgi:hypothetical protein